MEIVPFIKLHNNSENAISNRIFAIGDIHGCIYELEALFSHLESNHLSLSNDIFIFIGDYIDRGPDSKAVIDFLLNFQKKYANSIFLRGNHEDIFLSYIGINGYETANYLLNGGKDCLKSYSLREDETNITEILSKIPQSHIQFIKDTIHGIILEDFIFVHAGINPLFTIDNQTKSDILWIRGEFILNRHYLNKTVIFGHTPQRCIYLDLPYKIGIDTGLVFGNKLTCIELREKRIYQVLSGSGKVNEGRY